MIKEIIFNESDEIRLDKFLKHTISDVSRSKIQKLIKIGAIKVDGFVVKPSFVLKSSQIITYDKSMHVISDTIRVEPEKMKLDIIHEDKQIVVVNKPAGLVVHPGIGNKSGTLLNGLQYYQEKLSQIDSARPGVIHRLDKETSGVIIFAKTDEAHYFISNQFAERKVKKKYLSLVFGNVTCNGEVEGKIMRDPKNRLAFKMDISKGKHSMSEYEICEEFNLPITFLNVFPSTGRTHQIRVHLASKGFPIINDTLYGGGKNKMKSYNEKFIPDFKKIFNNIKRIALHASEIEFCHPDNKQIVKYEAPIPDDIISSLKLLRLI